MKNTIKNNQGIETKEKEMIEFAEFINQQINDHAKEKRIKQIEVEIEDIQKRILQEENTIIKQVLQDGISKKVQEKYNLQNAVESVELKRLRVFSDILYTLPPKFFGGNDMVIRITSDTNGKYVLNARIPRKSDIPAWSTYGFPYTAQAICDKIGLKVGGASANVVLYSYAKKHNKTIQEVVREAMGTMAK